jgi:pimeloyl-ACP methyl ester carboxylesterase
MQQMRVRPARRLPIAFGWLTRRGDAATAQWIRPVLTQPVIRRDTVRMLRVLFADSGALLTTADKLPAFDRPVLIAWAASDRVMPPEHGRRLASILPQARITEINDSCTLIPLDQPVALARAIAEFTGATQAAARQGEP